jgi:hypothetical protein
MVIMDGQSVKTTERGGDRGFDVHKRVKERKRRILVDTFGLLVANRAEPADISDWRACALCCLADRVRCFRGWTIIHSLGEFTAATVVFIGAKEGIVLSLLAHVRHGYRPHTAVLVRDQRECGRSTRPPTVRLVVTKTIRLARSVGGRNSFESAPH